MSYTTLDNSLKFTFLSEPYHTSALVVVGYSIDYDPVAKKKKTISLPEELKQHKNILTIDDSGDLANHMLAQNKLPYFTETSKYLLVVTDKNNFNQIENIINDATKPQYGLA